MTLETSRLPTTRGQFIRTNLIRFVIGALLAALIFIMLCLYIPFRREQRISNEIKQGGAYVVWEYRGPTWFPKNYRGSFRFFDRVDYVHWSNATDTDLARLRDLAGLHILDIHEAAITDDGLLHCQGLAELRLLDLSSTKISDVGLRHLHGMKIQYLYLNNTQITDAGLVQLRKLNNLEVVQLENTQITDSGLTHLNGLNQLHQIHLAGTHTTAIGRRTLEKNLTCIVYPYDADPEK